MWYGDATYTIIDTVVSDAEAIYAPVIGSKDVRVRNIDLSSMDGVCIILIFIIVSKCQLILLLLDIFPVFLYYLSLSILSTQVSRTVGCTGMLYYKWQVCFSLHNFPGHIICWPY